MAISSKRRTCGVCRHRRVVDDQGLCRDCALIQFGLMVQAFGAVAYIAFKLWERQRLPEHKRFVPKVVRAAREERRAVLAERIDPFVEAMEARKLA